MFTAGDFKSGPEPYTRDSMSENDKLAWNEFANPMWEQDDRYDGEMEEILKKEQFKIMVIMLWDLND